MDITIPAFIVLTGAVFYFLSHYSPKSDMIFYGLSAVFFLVGGTMGMVGYNDFPEGTETVVVVTSSDADNQTTSVTTEQNFDDNLFLDVIPAVFVLLGIYMFSVLMIHSRDN